MSDEYIYLWAQWGVLNHERHSMLLEYYEDLECAWKNVKPNFFLEHGMGQKKVDNIFELKNRISFEETTRIMKEKNVQLLYIEDDAYPSILKSSDLAPPFLFVRGKLPEFHKSLAVVGTRKMSGYGKTIAENFTADLVRSGFVIVSGLAFGVDSIAHRTAIQCHGITVAVMGTGVDQIYPSSNYRLAQDILSSGGALISAFPLGTPPLPHHFPQRNEIVAGLSQGTLVVEAPAKSGALLTADLAHQQGREVFAVPGLVNKFNNNGTNKLIREAGAKLVESADHIFEEFQMRGDIMKENVEFDEDELIVLDQLGLAGKSMDELFKETDFDIPQLSYILVNLQIKQVVRKEGIQWFVM